MELSIRKQVFVRLILFITISSLLALLILSCQKISCLIDYSTRIQHVQDIRISLQQIIPVVSEAESGQRGFLLTHDKSYLKVIDESGKKIHLIRYKLDTLMGFAPIQEQRLDTLMSIIDDQLKRLKETIWEENENILSVSMIQLSTIMHGGQIMMDQIRRIINDMQLYEDDLLARYTLENKRLILFTPIFFLLFSFMALGLLILSYFVIINEFKKSRNYELELKNIVEELKRSNTDLELFAYTASHDLQEPLRKIRLFSERLILADGSGLSDDSKTTILKIQNAAARMQALVGDLLNYSRLIIQTGTLENTNLNKLLEDVLIDLELQINNKNATINSETLPYLNIIPSLIRQLFQNLIDNSLKFSRKDNAPLILITSSRVKGSEFSENVEIRNAFFNKIEFRDNGIGFDEKYSDRIFEIFQRLHSRQEFEGTGIGLSICKKIMRIHNGFISAKSSPDNGSIFILYFPETVDVN